MEASEATMSKAIDVTLWKQAVEMIQGRIHELRNASYLQNLKEGKKSRFPPQGLQEKTALLTPQLQPSEPDFGLLTSRTLREHTCVVFSHYICGTLLQQP